MDKADFAQALVESYRLLALPAQHCGSGPNIHTTIKLLDELLRGNHQLQTHQ